MKISILTLLLVLTTVIHAQAPPAPISPSSNTVTDLGESILPPTQISLSSKTVADLEESILPPSHIFLDSGTFWIAEAPSYLMVHHVWEKDKRGKYQKVSALLDGYTNCSKNIIVLNSDQRSQDMKNTLVHEILHAMTCDSDKGVLSFNSTNENAHEGIYYLSPRLLDLMESNPALIAWLQDGVWGLEQDKLTLKAIQFTEGPIPEQFSWEDAPKPKDLPRSAHRSPKNLPQCCQVENPPGILKLYP